MNELEFNELAGRIEGLSRVVLRLVATLEDAQLIDGPRFADGLRGSVRPRGPDDQILVRAFQVLDDVADALDAARGRRQSAGDPAEIRESRMQPSRRQPLEGDRVGFQPQQDCAAVSIAPVALEVTAEKIHQDAAADVVVPCQLGQIDAVGPQVGLGTIRGLRIGETRQNQAAVPEEEVRFHIRQQDVLQERS